MENMEARVARHLRSGEFLLLLTDTDLSAEGTFGARWLAVTSDRLLVFSPNGGMAGPDSELPMREVKELRARRLVGQVALEADVNSHRVELLRCTNAHSERFSRIAKSVSDACKESRPPQFVLEEEARVCPNCGALLTERGGICPTCVKKRKVLARLWKYMRPYRSTALLTCGTTLLITLFELVPPYLIKLLVDGVLLGKGGIALLGILVGALAVQRLASTAIWILQSRLTISLGSRLLHDVREDFYAAVQRLSLRRYDRLQTGMLIARLTGDTSWLNFFFSDIGMYIVPQILLLAGITVMLFVLNPVLALVVVVPAPVVMLLSVLFFRRLGGMYHRLWQRHCNMNAQAYEAISGLRTVKAFSQEGREIERFSQRSGSLVRAAVEADRMCSTAFPIIGFLTTAGTFVVWYLGGIQVKEGEMAIGSLMAFLGYGAMFYGPVNALTRYIDLTNRAFTAAQRVFEVLDAEQEVYDTPEAKPLEGPRGRVEFSNVHFGYVKDRPILKGITFAVEPGEMIGLVGPSGAGKTTVTNLICRFYDVDEGCIRIDGADVRDIRLRDLRRHIGVVPQDCFLFDGTIHENIAYGKPEASREDVLRAAIAANAHGFILRQAEGYETRVGERGARLSGGEKQRIAIARAILHDPKVLILDEATSSVDTETEELIQQALQRLTANRTTFAIAHRLSTLRHASRLLVIENGHMAEFGTHDELLARKGLYWRLVEMQSRLSALNAVGR